MLIDARSVPNDAEFACDVCVVGAGPAGVALVDRLRDSGLSIVLLESGDFDPNLANQRLLRGKNNGQRYFRLDRCRYRAFGGSTVYWGGWCRPLEPVDFERREWLPWSGWPISEQALKPYYADTGKVFGLTNAPFDLPAWRGTLPAPLPLENTNFENVLFQYSPITNFGETYRARLVGSANVTTIIRANLTQMNLSPGTSRIDTLKVASLSGRSLRIHPRAVVLAAGGIENARLLLASRSDRPAGMGNEFDLVGRFFMEHLHVPVGHIDPEPGFAARSFYRQARYDGVEIRGAVQPTSGAQGRHRLLATSIAIEPQSYSFGAPYLAWPQQLTFGPSWLYRRLSRGALANVLRPLKRNAERTAGLSRRYRTWRAASRARARSGSRRLLSLYFRAEQVPDPASRVTLSDRRDPLGVPEVQLAWRVNPFDIHSINGWLDVLDRDVRARGIGRIVPPAPDWESEIVGGPHHIGTTRMSADARSGVVDENCRVHSVDNLYVAGSSVFTTGGYANPTFTLVALALRLADTLRDRLSNSHSLCANR